ncbi:phospholipase [Oceanobacillus zhaokaii]|uniref:Phospholipase n=1 Tax=Oceanobacillus zhaokaii TaxID=2052660 RepID=A0A345PEV1_9BACI|nr:phospholipase [Oceanobacillus zhaokaii]AXI08531.1 phospholipase [Oceanobacillus zhaokaii]
MNNRRRRSPRFCIFPGYNWCGPGCSGPDKPINAVDAACKEHDICYRKTRDYCRCDDQFVNRLTKLQDPYTEEGRQARLMLQYMRIQRDINCLFR